MEEEARDWCLLKEAEWYISARSKSRVMDYEDVVIDNLTKEEAIAFLSSVGKAEKWAWTEDGFSVYVEE